MRVFFFNSNASWGGGEKWHLETALSFKKKGYDVSVFAAKGKTLLLRAAESGITTCPVNIGNLSFINPFTLLRLSGMFRKHNPDVLLLSLPSDLKAAGIAALLAGVKKIIYRRGSAIPVKDTILNRFLFRRVITDLIANSEETKKTILRNNTSFFDPARISVIYNGIDLDHFDSLTVNDLIKKEEGCIYIGTAGRLEAEKNHKVLVNVAKKLLVNRLNFKIFIAGKGSHEKSINRLAIKEKVSEKIILTGFTDPVKGFLQSMDIFVLPSFYEGFGFVKIEAMACRKPVIAFNTSSNPEIIIHNETGLLADPGNPDDFADKILFLARNKEIRESMGEKGRLLVEQKFSMKISLEKLEKIFTS